MGWAKWHRKHCNTSSFQPWLLTRDFKLGLRTGWCHRQENRGKSFFLLSANSNPVFTSSDWSTSYLTTIYAGVSANIWCSLLIASKPRKKSSKINIWNSLLPRSTHRIHSSHSLIWAWITRHPKYWWISIALWTGVQTQIITDNVMNIFGTCQFSFFFFCGISELAGGGSPY